MEMDHLEHLPGASGGVEDRDVRGRGVGRVAAPAAYRQVDRLGAVAGQRPQIDAEDHHRRRHPWHLNGDDLERLSTRLIAGRRQTVRARDDGDRGPRRLLCCGERGRCPEPEGLVDAAAVDDPTKVPSPTSTENVT